MSLDVGGMVVRVADERDEPFLWHCLTLAAFAASIEATIAVPALAKYVADWGQRRGDVAIIGEVAGVSVGAAWARHFSPAEQPYVYVNERTAELAIGVVSEYRSHGIGAILLDALIKAARGAEWSGLCLSVREDNPAIRLYERFGFCRILGSESSRDGRVSFGMALAFDVSIAHGCRRSNGNLNAGKSS